MESKMTKLPDMLEAWRQGRASIPEVRSLAADIGNQHQYFEPGLPALMELLNHDDEIVRYNSAMSLAYEFHFAPAASRLLAMLAEDPDDDCRDMAAGAIGNICHDGREPQVLFTLGKAALEDPDEGVRVTAYRAPLRVNGLSTDEYLQSLKEQNLSVDRNRVEKIVAGVKR